MRALQTRLLCACTRTHTHTHTNTHTRAKLSCALHQTSDLGIKQTCEYRCVRGKVADEVNCHTVDGQFECDDDAMCKIEAGAATRAPAPSAPEGFG